MNVNHHCWPKFVSIVFSAPFFSDISLRACRRCAVEHNFSPHLKLHENLPTIDPGHFVWPWVTEVHRPFYIQNSSLKFSHLLQIIILLSPGLNLYYFHCKWACKIHSAVIWGPWIPDNSGSVLNADFTSWPSVLPLPSFHVTNHLEFFSPVCKLVCASPLLFQLPFLCFFTVLKIGFLD